MIDENTSTESVNPLKKRGPIIILTGLFLVAIIVLGIVMREHEPNYYAPGRTLLVNAKIKLEQTVALEEASIKKRRQAHREIEKAIANLVSVAKVDPQDTALITDLLRQFKEIEAEELGGLQNGDKLHDQYRSVIRKMDKLIQKLEKLHT